MRAAVLAVLLAGCAATVRPPPPTDDLELPPALEHRARPEEPIPVSEPEPETTNQVVTVSQDRDEGARIDLSVRDADVADVMRMIAAAAKISVVVTDDVAARVTLDVRNVTWRQAIDVIADLEGLDVKEDRGIVTVTRSRQ
jgi:type II secretory pathway component HofQ